MTLVFNHNKLSLEKTQVSLVNQPFSSKSTSSNTLFKYVAYVKIIVISNWSFKDLKLYLLKCNLHDGHVLLHI